MAQGGVIIYRVRWTVEQREKFRARWIGFRLKYGLTQDQLANAMGVHKNTVQRIEKGRYVASANTVLRFTMVEGKYKQGDIWMRELQEVPGHE